MATLLPYSIHPVAEAVASIDQGEDPWFAFGCFLHDWWRYAADRRQELIITPPAPTKTTEGNRWAAFFAAVVEELCFRTAIPCPAWTQKQEYVLDYPWFHSLQLSQRDWLLSTTPEPFKRHNIFVGGSILDNKYAATKLLALSRDGLFGQNRISKIWQRQMMSLPILCDVCRGHCPISVKVGKLLW